jgi:hypothetical protein
MCLLTLQDKVRGLGMGAMYEGHLANGGFRDLLDGRSAEWASTPVAQKVIDLRGFEAAGVSAAELVGHYRQSLARQPGGEDGLLAGLAAAMRTYRAAGYAPPLPPDVEAAVREQP